jgi:AraC family transcriptional regulator
VHNGVDHRVVRRSAVHGCEALEIAYAACARVQRGPGAHPLLTITLSGCAMESDATGVIARRLMSCSLLPAAASSIATVCDDGWRVLVAELSEPWVRDRVNELGLAAQHGSTSGSTYELCERFYREFVRGDSAAAVAMEGLVLQLVAEIARTATAKRERRPAWLDGVRAFIDANYRSSLNLGELARAARVHPAHLSKSFSRSFGCTIGDYVRGLRVDFARRQMESSELTLSEIAIAAGFADQSHFTKTFKRIVGKSPSEYRHESKPAPALPGA